MSFACQVSGCRYSSTHKTSQHRCGVCWNFGHGVVEHGSWQHILDLSSIAINEDDASIATCTVPNCPAPHSHMTSGHHCARCRRRCDANHNCIISDITIRSPPHVRDAYAFLRMLYDGGYHPNNTNLYTTVSSFGHTWTIIAHANKGECAHLRSDAQGQYIPEEDDRDIINWFRGDRTYKHYDQSTRSPIPQPQAPPPAPAPAATGFSPLLNRMHAEAGLPPPTPTFSGFGLDGLPYRVQQSPPVPPLAHAPPAPPLGHAPLLPVAYSDSDSDEDIDYYSATTTDKCPVCRAHVAKPGGITEVFGVTAMENCSVCLSEPVSWIFTGCGHMAVCKECAQRWV